MSDKDIPVDDSKSKEQYEEYQEWLAFAKTDYQSADYLNGASFYPRPFNVICYHCQQAAEKAVKALIVYFGSQGGMPKVHDISFLLTHTLLRLKVLPTDGIFSARAALPNLA